VEASLLWRAVLVPDRGQRALGEEYFRSAPHLHAEGVTHTLVLEGGGGATLCVPLVVRPIEGEGLGELAGLQDAVSPYGFPGGALSGPGAPPNGVPKGTVDWRGVELVSIFVRDRIGGPCCFSGATERAQVSVIDTRVPVEFRRNHRCNIRRNVELGYRTTCLPARECSREERAGFMQVYRETMVRHAASPRFFFSDDYFEQVLDSPRAWLVTTRAPDGHVAAAALNVLSDGYLHNYLGGTGDGYLTHSPFKNVIDGLVGLSRRLEAPIHLGGGVRPGDGIENFKRGFANATAHFYTHELVCDPARYASLCAAHGPGEPGFFPAYRAPPPAPPTTH
jgi:hypothetical protein